MRRSDLWRALLLLIAAPYVAGAQQVCGIAVSEVTAFEWDAFQATAADALVANDAQGVYRALKATALSQPWPIAFSGSVQARLDALIDGNLVPAAWVLTAEERNGNVFDKQFSVFSGTDKIWLPPKQEHEDCGAGEQARLARAEFYRFVQLVQTAVNELTDPARKAVWQRLGILEARYDKYLFEGHPMFPWEAAVNSWFLTDKHIANGPPRNQFTLLHPSAGLIG
ncbi:MAG: hypothetical protein AAFX85_20435, partial [Pseudomonadota bacterium]